MARELAANSPAPAAPAAALALVEADAAARSRLASSFPNEPDATVATIEELDDYPAATGPTVVVFGPSFSTEDGLREIHAFTRARPEAGAVLIVRRMATKLLKAALRAGVRDVLVEPVDELELHEAIVATSETLPVAPLAVERPAEPGKVVTVFSSKGGVGTSVVAANVAAALARRAPGSVALVDVDLQFGDAAVLFNLPPRHTIIDAIAGSGDRELVQQLLHRHEATRVLVLPAPVDPALADSVTASDVTALIETLRHLCSYVVIDTPSSFNDTVLSLIEMSDEIVMVGSDDVPTVKNIKVAIQALRMLNVPEHRVSLVLNRLDGKGRMHRSEIERALQFPVAATIPTDRAVTDSVNRGNPVVVDAPKSKVARVFALVADRVIAQTAQRRPIIDSPRSN